MLSLLSEGRPAILRSVTGDELVPEGQATRVNEPFCGPRYQIGDVVTRKGRKIHGERNLREPCTVIFVDKFAKPFHYTVRDPFGQELGVVETHLRSCKEIMYLGNRENARVCEYKKARHIPEQETREGVMQDKGFRVERVANRKIRRDDLDLPVERIRNRYARPINIPDEYAEMTEKICWFIIISASIFIVWVQWYGPGNTINPLKEWWQGNGWITDEEWDIISKYQDSPLFRTQCAVYLAINNPERLKAQGKPVPRDAILIASALEKRQNLLGKMKRNKPNT